MARSGNTTRVILSRLALGLLLVAAVVGAYQHVWHAGYIWDDDVYVTANPLLTSPDGLKRIWFSLDSPSQYFPLVYTVFRIEHLLWGFDPAGYHWVNILLHAANSLLLWRLLSLLRIRSAWLGAALFALHPVQVESVAWITELKNVLMGFFFLLTLLCWVRFVRPDTWRRGGYYILALCFYALALLSKTTACTLPAALLLILWLERKPITVMRWLQIAPFIVLAAAMATLTTWWERYHQGTQGGAFEVGLPERLLVASRAVWFYLWKLVWPNDLSFSYPRWAISITNTSDYLWPALIVVAIVAICFVRRYFGRGLEVALLFFVVTLAPVLGFVMLWTFRYSWVADHYQYLACIGPLALLGATVHAAAAKPKRLQASVVAVSSVLLLCPLGLRTWQQAAIYSDAETLWRATILANPSSALAHNSLGVLLGARNAPVEDEMAEYERAIESDANDPEAHNNLGFALARLGRTDEALQEYERSVALDPRYAVAHGNLATILLQLGRMPEAIEHLERILVIDPRNAALQESLGTLLANDGKQEAALEHWKRSLALEPRNGPLQRKVGRTLAADRQLEGALPYLHAAAEVDGQNADAHFEYASALSLVGRLDEAVPEYEAALRIRPDFREAHGNLAAVLRQLGRADEAEIHARLSGEPQPAP